MPREVICISSDDEDSAPRKEPDIVVHKGAFRRVPLPVPRPIKLYEEVTELPVAGPSSRPRVTQDVTNRRLNRVIGSASNALKREEQERRRSRSHKQEKSPRCSLNPKIEGISIDLTADDPVPVEGSKDLPIELSDPDSDDETTTHAAYDINHARNWTPIPIKTELLEGDIGDSVKELTATMAEMLTSIPTRLNLRSKEKAKMARAKTPAAGVPITPLAGLSPGERDSLVWNQLRAAQMFSLAGPPTSRRPVGMSQPRRTAGTAAFRFLNAREIRQPVLAAGAINSIVQSQGKIAIASCVLGGSLEDEDHNADYNDAGALQVLEGDDVYVLHGHETYRRANTDTNIRCPRKYFTVNDVQFDPADPNRLVSCGRDGQVLIWDCHDMKARYEASLHDDTELAAGTKNFEGLKATATKAPAGKNAVPEGMHFKPSGSTLAVWSSDGSLTIFDHEGAAVLSEKAPRKSSLIQSVAWGKGASENLLYTTSGHARGGSSARNHRILDIQHERTTLFGKAESGECLDIDSSGRALAHITRSDADIFTLATYDLTRLGAPASTTALPAFAKLGSARVQQVAYSPGALHLAVARSDNVTHVYDARFLGRRPLHALRHAPAVEACEEDAEYGIYRVEWVEDRAHGLHLATCGADGCVRLWDMKRASDPHADTIIAQSTSYASWFSLGDTSKGEKTLILGDGSGNIVIKE